jgi:site-specific recombinase XerD
MAASVSLSRFAGDLRMANRATGTIQSYVSSARRFEEFAGIELADASQESVRRWVDHLRSQAVGASRLGQHYAALKFLYARTLGQPDKVAWITIPKAKAHLPSILGRPEIQRLLDGFTTAKYRMFFTLIYATGLRITEATRTMLCSMQSWAWAVLMPCSPRPAGSTAGSPLRMVWTLTR